MIGYIYKTTNLVNGKIYIGKRQKAKFDVNYIGSGKKLKSAIKHYGKNNFKCEIIEWCETVDQLNTREIYWIDYFNAKDELIGYNISDGGTGGDIFHTLPLSEQNNYKEFCKKNGHANKGRCRIYKDTEIKNVWPDELEAYLSAGWIHGLPPFLAKQQGQTRTGKKHSKEWIEHLKLAQQKRAANLTEEDRQKMSNSTKKQMAKLSVEERHKIAMAGVEARRKYRKGKKLIWVNKAGIKKYIDEKEWPKYEANGWKRGMK